MAHVTILPKSLHEKSHPNHIFSLRVMGATFVYPKIPVYTSGLSDFQDAAYLVMAKRVLLDGVLGLLIAGLFSASLSALNTGLNRAAGIFVRSFCVAVFRPDAKPNHQVWIRRWLTFPYGAIIVGVAIALGLIRSCLCSSSACCSVQALPCPSRSLSRSCFSSGARMHGRRGCRRS